MAEVDSAVSCSLSPDGQEVTIHIDSSKVRGKVTYEMLYESLLDGGYLGFKIDKELLRELASLNYKTTGSVHKVVAEKTDALIEIELAEDEMIAWLSVEEPYGGKPVSKEMVLECLKAKGITDGIKEDVIGAAVANGNLNKTVIAEGIPPTQGQNAWFENLISEQDQAPKKLDDGSVDFYDLSYVITVEAGDPLLRKHPPTPGEPGKTVTGQVLPAIDGEDKSLVPSVGSAVSDEDPHILIATRPGKPISRRNSVVVDDILTMPRVDVSTGNITFNGSVVIYQSVDSGFEVHAGGSIEVLGSVEDAILEAGSDITIKSGVTGNTKARIVSGGCIRSRFIQNAYVECEKDLIVTDGLLYCDAHVAGNVLVGADQGKGQINGGKVMASKLIKARILGSAASSKTILLVGENPYFAKKKQEKQEVLNRKKRELEEIIKTIIFIRTKGHDKKDQLPDMEEKREDLMQDVNKLTDMLLNLQKMLEKPHADARIVGLDQVYSGVYLSISGISRNLTLDSPGSSFYLRAEKEIVLGPILESDRDWDVLPDKN